MVKALGHQKTGPDQTFNHYEWVQSLSRMSMAIIRDYSEVHSSAVCHSHCERCAESPGHMTARRNSHRNHAEGIRTLEIPAPYYSDRLRWQFPPSSHVLTLGLLCLHSSISQLFPRDTCYTQCLDILMSMERTSEPLSGRYMDIAATFYYIRNLIPFIMSVSTQLNPHGHHQ